MSAGLPVVIAAEQEVDSMFRRLRRWYWWSLGIAIAIHLGLIVGVTTVTRTEEGQAAEPAKVKFFTRRDPLLAKPLELRKVPQPKRQMVRREMQVSAARMDQVRAAAFDTRGLIAGQGSGVSAIGLPRQMDGGPRAAMGLEMGLGAQSMNASRTVENKIDMALEMLDVNSMDTGRYRAMVIQDSKDRQALKGFVKFAQVMSASAVSAGSAGWGTVNVRTIDALRDAVNSYTGLQADFIGSIAFDDERLMEVPIIIPQGAPNESEMEHLAKYLIAGGFVFGGVWGEALEKYGGLVNGRDFWSERLPENHPIFTAFFDIKGGMTSGVLTGSAQGKFGMTSWNYLIGYFVKGRLAAVAPGQGWGWDSATALAEAADATRQIQMAVNIIIYALTQEGSMTQRLMQMVN
ncbi:MAG: DUF4159 domain-containing protein [Candidatus Latescibacteria bacterium]|nr:DUF4159 domain-containing protein [Candidatus Latescibacterota bacterium]